mgnify:CR=1 FL=1
MKAMSVCVASGCRRCSYAFQLGLCDIRFGKESRIYRGIVQHVVPEPDVVDLGMVDRGRFQTCLPDDRV